MFPLPKTKKISKQSHLLRVSRVLKKIQQLISNSITKERKITQSKTLEELQGHTMTN